MRGAPLPATLPSDIVKLKQYVANRGCDCTTRHLRERDGPPDIPLLGARLNNADDLAFDDDWRAACPGRVNLSWRQGKQ